MNTPRSDSRPTLPWTTIALVAALMALAVALRLPWLGGESFWYDEACSADFIRGGLSRILRVNALDTHPPLYYLGLRVWSEAMGDGDAALRAYSLAWSLAGLALLFGFVREVGGRRAALFALAVGAVNPLDVYFARETRMYVQAAVLGLASAWILWRWLTSQGVGRQRAALWIGYVLTASALISTHYSGANLLLVQGFFALAWLIRRRRFVDALAYAGAGATVSVLYMPWILYVRSLRDALWSGEIAGWVPEPEWSDLYIFVAREFFWGHVDALANRYTWLTLTVGLAVVAYGAATAKGRAPGGKSRDASANPAPPLGVYLLCLIFGAAATALAISVAYHPAFYRPRFALLLAPPFFALAGLACAKPRNPLFRSLLAAALIVPMTVASVWTLRVPSKTDWRAIAEALSLDAQPPSVLVHFPWYAELPLNRYLSKPISRSQREEVEALLAAKTPQEIDILIPSGHPVVTSEAQSYLAWLLQLGETTVSRLPSDVRWIRVRFDPDSPPGWNGRFEQWYPVFDYPGHVGGFDDPASFHGRELTADNRWFRWATPQGKLWLADVEAGRNIVLRVEGPPPQPGNEKLELYLTRTNPAQGVFHGLPTLTRPVPPPGVSEIVVQAPPGEGHCWVGWKTPAYVPASVAGSNDSRALAFVMRWIGVERLPADADGRALDERAMPLRDTSAVRGFEDGDRFHGLEYGPFRPHRWSKPTAWLRLDPGDAGATVVLRAMLPPRVVEDYRPRLRAFARRAERPTDADDARELFGGAPLSSMDEWTPGEIELALPVAAGPGPVQVGWRLEGVNLARAGIGTDDRDLGLDVYWVGWVGEPAP